MQGPDPDPGVSTDAGYEDRARGEAAHYSALLKERSPSERPQRHVARIEAFQLAMRIYRRYLRSKMPDEEIDPYVLRRQKSAGRRLRLLSLGCGTADWELALAVKAAGGVELCLADLSEELLDRACRYAIRKGIPLTTTVCDVNKIRLQPRHYDFIVCRSSLHHFIALEHVIEQVKSGLSDGGEFVVIGEWVGRNGLMVYPETEEVAQAIFAWLPSRFRFNHYTKVIDKRVPNIDHSLNTFEAVRSEEILPMLLREFKPVQYVTFDAFLSLLLDFRYGPNYDLSSHFDRCLVSLITQMDLHMIANSILRPTALFGIFRP